MKRGRRTAFICFAAALLTGLFSVSVLLILTSAAPEKPAVPTAVTAPAPDTLAARLDEICAAYGAVGAQAAAIRGDEILLYQYGYADREAGRAVTADTKYRVASLSKLAADMVFLGMEEDGLVRRHADIGDYLGYPVRNPLYPTVPVTPEMLMCHLSSLRDSDAFLASRQQASAVPLAQLLQREDSFSETAPGTAYLYSNFGVAVLGAVCEKAANTPFNVLARMYLFSKLEIDAAFAARELPAADSLGVLYGPDGLSAQAQLSAGFSSELGQTHHLVQGNLTISAQDYARLLYPLLHEGVGFNGARLLRPDTVKAVVSPHFTSADGGVGYGLRILQNAVGPGRQLVHTGSNFGMLSAFVIWPETGNAAVVLTSGARGDVDPATGIYRVCYDLIRAIGDSLN